MGQLGGRNLSLVWLTSAELIHVSIISPEVTWTNSSRLGSLCVGALARTVGLSSAPFISQASKLGWVYTHGEGRGEVCSL